MKKQINPSIKAHLIRGAFYLVLLIAICAIPFALAQRNAGKQMVLRAPFNHSQLAKFPYSSVRERGHLQFAKFPYSSVRERGSLLAAPAGEKSPTPTPSASQTPTATPGPGCGLLVGDGLAVGFAPNNFTLIASNIVNFTFSNSQAAPNDFAVFQTHDPFGATVVEDAITAAGHSFSVFTPGQLAGFDFTQYRVIILNWDDHFVTDFIGDYAAAIPALEAYVSGGGVVWVQGAIQGEGEGGDGQSYPLPFGGQSNFDLSSSDPILDPSSPMVAGVPSPITGNFASQVSDEGLPDDADVVVVNCHDENGAGGDNCGGEGGGGDEQKPVLYDLRRGTSCGPSPTPSVSPTPTASASPTPTASASQTPTPSASPTPTPTPSASPTATPSASPTPSSTATPRSRPRKHPRPFPRPH
jgi:hypothetical protein